MLDFSTTNEDNLLAICHGIDRALRIEQYRTWHEASVVCLGEGGTKTWAGGRLRSQDHTNSECGSDLVNILLQILCYPSLV